MTPLAVVLLKILGCMVAAGIYALSQVSWIKGGNVEQLLIGLAGFLVGSVLVQLPMPGIKTPSTRPPSPPSTSSSSAAAGTTIVGLVVMTLGALVAFGFSLSGCGGTFEEARIASPKMKAAPASERCIELDDRHASWGTVAKGAAFGAGASGLATIPAKSDELKTVLAITSVGVGVLAASASFASDAAATSWARECSQ